MKLAVSIAISLSAALIISGNAMAQGKIGPKERTLESTRPSTERSLNKTNISKTLEGLKEVSKSAEKLETSKNIGTENESTSLEKQAAVRSAIEGTESGATLVTKSYSDLAVATAKRDTDSGLAKFVTEATNWDCEPCQIGLANRLSQAREIATKNELAPREGLQAVMERDGSMERYKDMCKGNPIGFRS